MNVQKFLRPLVVVLLAAGVLVYFSGRSEMKGKPFWFQAKDLEGYSVSQADSAFAGKVVVVDIWGTWCPPCRAEIPHLNSLYKTYKDEGLEIVGVAFENSPDPNSAARDLRRFMKEFQIEYRVLYGGTPTQADLQQVFPDLDSFGGFPTTIVLDREGTVREVTVGFSPDLMRKLEAAVRECLADI